MKKEQLIKELSDYIEGYHKEIDETSVEDIWSIFMEYKKKDILDWKLDYALTPSMFSGDWKPDAEVSNKLEGKLNKLWRES